MNIDFNSKMNNNSDTKDSNNKVIEHSKVYSGNIDGRYPYGDPLRYTGGDWLNINETITTPQKCSNLCLEQPECTSSDNTCKSHFYAKHNTCYCSFDNTVHDVSKDIKKEEKEDGRKMLTSEITAQKNLMKFKNTVKKYNDMTKNYSSLFKPSKNYNILELTSPSSCQNYVSRLLKSSAMMLLRLCGFIVSQKPRQML